MRFVYADKIPSPFVWDHPNFPNGQEGQVQQADYHRKIPRTLNLQTAESIRSTIADLKRQAVQYEGYKQKAYDDLVRGVTDEETYHRVVAGYSAHERWILEELDRQREDLELAEQRVLDASSIQSIYPVLKERLERATEEDKRFVLVCLGARVVIGSEGTTLELAVPQQILQGAVSTIPGFPAGEFEGVSPQMKRSRAGGWGEDLCYLPTGIASATG